MNKAIATAIAVVMFMSTMSITATHALEIGGRLTPNLFQLQFHWGAEDHRFSYGGWIGATANVLKTTFTTPTRLHAVNGKESKMSKVQKVAITVGTIGLLYLAHKEIEDAKAEKKKYKRRVEQLRKELESERETETAGEGEVVNQDGERTSDITSKDDALVITEIPEDGGVPAPRTSPPLNEKEEESYTPPLPKDGGVPIIYIGKRDLENNPDEFDPDSDVHNAEVKWCTRINGWCWRGKQMAHDYKPRPIVLRTPTKPKPKPKPVVKPKPIIKPIIKPKPVIKMSPSPQEAQTWLEDFARANWNKYGPGYSSAEDALSKENFLRLARTKFLHKHLDDLDAHNIWVDYMNGNTKQFCSYFTNCE